MTIKDQIYYPEELKTNDHIEKKKDRKQRRTPQKIFNLRREDILSYIIVKFDEIGDPIYSEELAEYFNLSIKRINEYLLELEKINFVKRSKKTCPMPIYPTSEGRESHYRKALELFPERIRPKIEQQLMLRNNR